MQPSSDEPHPPGEPLATAPHWQAAQPGNRPPLVDSDTLMRGHRTIEISHKGTLYRLQATRQGKLILTK